MEQSKLEQDAGQSMVPFIDTQKVEQAPHVLISGAGLYHKNLKTAIGEGGFLALKLITYDITPHINTVFVEKIET